MATFADDTVILTVGDDVETVANKVQSSIAEVCAWTKRWRIKLNESKSVHINFTNRKVGPERVYINGREEGMRSIPIAFTLGIIVPNVTYKVAQLRSRRRGHTFICTVQCVIIVYVVVFPVRTARRELGCY